MKKGLPAGATRSGTKPSRREPYPRYGEEILDLTGYASLAESLVLVGARNTEGISMAKAK